MKNLPGLCVRACVPVLVCFLLSTLYCYLLLEPIFVGNNKKGGGTDEQLSFSTRNGAESENAFPPVKVNCIDRKVEAELEHCWNSFFTMENASTGAAGGKYSLENITKDPCRAYYLGNECINLWRKSCSSSGGVLNEKDLMTQQMNRLEGLIENLNIFCNVVNIRRTFIRHRNCFGKVSREWDKCTLIFLQRMKEMNYFEKNLSHLCCARFRWLECVRESTSHFCRETSAFRQNVEDNLSQMEIRFYRKTKCIFVSPKNDCNWMRRATRWVYFCLIGFYISGIIMIFWVYWNYFRYFLECRR